MNSRERVRKTRIFRVRLALCFTTVLMLSGILIVGCGAGQDRSASPSPTSTSPSTSPTVTKEQLTVPTVTVAQPAVPPAVEASEGQVAMAVAGVISRARTSPELLACLAEAVGMSTVLEFTNREPSAQELLLMSPCIGDEIRSVRTDSQRPTSTEVPTTTPPLTITPPDDVFDLYSCAAQDALPVGVWVSTGGPVGGLGYNIRYSSDDPKQLFVTDAWTGLHTSANSGMTWVSSNGDGATGIDFRTGPTFDNIPVFSLLVDPNAPDTIWVGMLDNGGVYRSDDRGMTWVALRDGLSILRPAKELEDEEIDPVDEEAREQITVRGIQVEPGNSDVVYVTGELGTRNDGFLFERTRGFVFRSTDRGESFELLQVFPNLTRWLFVHPDDPDRLLLTTGIFDREPDIDYEGDLESLNLDKEEIGSGLAPGMYVSDDGGRSWMQSNNGISEERSRHFGGAAVHPTHPGTVLVGSGNDIDLLLREMHGGLYLTTDFGKSWIDVTPPDPVDPSRGEEIMFGAVAFAPSNPERAYAAGEQTFMRSEDGGRTWARVIQNDGSANGRDKWGPPGINPGNPIDMVVHPDDPDVVLINNYGGGAFVTQNAGLSWADASHGYTGANVVGIDVSNSGCVLANGRSQVWVLNPVQMRWTGINYGEASWLGDGSLAAFVEHDNHETALLAGDANGGFLVRSNDSGATWTRARGLSDAESDSLSDDQFGLHAVAVSSADPNRIYAGYIRSKIKGVNPHEYEDIPRSPGMFRSNDGGLTWLEVNGGLPAGPGSRNVTAVAASHQDPETVYIATLLGGPFLSRDGGESWTSIMGELPGDLSWEGCLPMCVDSSGDLHPPDEIEDEAAFIKRKYSMSIAVDPDDDSHVLLGTTAHGVLESYDHGINWGPVLEPTEVLKTSHRDHIHAVDIHFDPTDSEVFYVADWNSGVVATSDGGRTYERLREGLTSGVVQDLALSRDGMYLYAATEGHGVFVLRTY